MRSFLTAGALAGFAITTPVWAQDTPTEAPAAPAAETPAGPAGAAAEAPDYDATTVLATVDGTEITLGNLIALRDRLPPQYQNLPDDVLFPGILEQLVDQTLLAKVASASPETDPLAIRLLLENERRGSLAARTVEARVGEAVDPADIEAAYQKLVADFQPAPEFNASHILVATEEEANSVKTELDAGGDFAALAQEHSSDGSAAAGGELGWFGAGQMVPEFDQAVATLETGAVAGPVKSQFGWHLIKLNEKRESSPPPLEQVRAELEAAVRQDMLQTEVQALRAEAEIEMAETSIPPSAIRDTELLQE